MGFDFINQVKAVVELDHTGVVGEDRHEPVNFFADLFGGFLDVALVEVADLFGLAGAVIIFHIGSKDLVLAVFGPGLGENFQFHVRGVLVQTVFFTILRRAEVVLNGLHFFEAEGERALLADLHQTFIAHIEVELADNAGSDAFDDRLVQGDGGSGDLRLIEDANGFDEFVGKEVFADLFHVSAIQGGSLDQIFHRTEDLFRLAELSADDVANGFMSGTGNVIRHARSEPDGDNEVEVDIVSGGTLPDGPLLSNGVRQFLRDLFCLFIVNIGRNGKDVSCADFFHAGDGKDVLNTALDGFCPGVRPFLADSDLNSVVHSDSFVIYFIYDKKHFSIR